MLLAAVLAGVCTLMLATRAFVAFESVRVKLVRTPVAAAGGEVRVATAGETRLDRLQPPFVVVARIHNGLETAARFSVHLQGQAICDADVAPGASRRLDCLMTVGWNSTASHAITVRGSEGSWSLEYLEVSNQHGASHGGLDLLILPAGATRYSRPAWPWLVITWLALMGAFAIPLTREMPTSITWVHRLLGGLVAGVFVAALLSPVVSRYQIVLAAGSVAKGTLILLLPHLWQSLTGASRWVSQRSPSASIITQAVLVGLLVAIAYGSFVAHRLAQYRGNYSGFLQISRTAVDRVPFLSGRDDIRATLVQGDGGGYDGQFLYFATFDPFLRLYAHEPWRYRDVVDAPPYRFGRIGFSLLTKVISGDRWQRYPSTMVWLIVIGHFVCAAAIALIAHQHGRSPAWGALVVLIPGFWQSLQVGLPEALAAAGLVSGYWALLRNRLIWVAILFAGSLLIRETGAIFVLCLAAANLLSGRRKEAVLILLGAVAPLVLWRLYVGWVLYPDWGHSAFLFNPQNLGAPFAGIANLWETIGRGEYYPGAAGLARAGAWYLVLLCGGAGMAVALAIRTPGPVAIAAAVYALVAVSLNFDSIWVHVGNGERGTYELFLMLALSTVTVNTYSRALSLGLTLLWLGAAGYLLFGAFDATLLRQLLLAPVW